MANWINILNWVQRYEKQTRNKKQKQWKQQKLYDNTRNKYKNWCLINHLFTSDLFAFIWNLLSFAGFTLWISQIRKEYNQWYKLHQLFGSNDGKKFHNIAQSYVLRHLLTEANHYLYRLSNRYELECQPGLLTILIRDKEAGGVTRPTTTISGGEGFLISLSLALGLSSLSKKALSVDTLFIDEGFGTLDSTYLSTVMDTLERLHQMGGKKIGIISHVESLKERLTTQIQVIKENNTTSRVCVKNTL